MKTKNLQKKLSLNKVTVSTIEVSGAAAPLKTCNESCLESCYVTCVYPF